MNLKTQFELLIYAYLIGIYLGVTYDLLYYFILMHTKKILKAILDIFFFICQGFIIFNVIYRINNGIIPPYCYILMGLGFATYYSYSNKYYKEVVKPIKHLINRCLSRLIIIFKYLFVKPFLDSYSFLLSIFLFFKKKLSSCVKIAKKRIKIHKEAKETKKNKTKI